VGPQAIPGKSEVPLLPGAYLARERLRLLWPRLERCRVVVLEAGAGYGKTTLLAANVGASGRRLLWYTCDALDGDFSGFCRNLAGALGIELPESSADAADQETQRSKTLLVGLLQQLQASGKGWNLVFDDLHSVRSIPTIASFLNDLARLLPTGCTLFLASREPAGIRTGKLRALGQVATVSARDLQFTRPETATLFRAALPDRPTPARDLDRITTRTEGWAAGLGICLRFLEATPGQTLKQALDRLDSAGPDWFSYFAEEVLDALELPLQEFLLRASLLPRLEPALADAILGIRNSRELLETLHRRNLFTFPLSEARASYRFHQLFQEFLQRQLERKVSASEIQRLRRRAARRLAAEGAWLDAAEACAAAGDSATALGILEKRGKEVTAQGHSGRLLRVLEGLPARSFAGRPGALLVLGQAHDVQGHWDEAQRIYARALRARPPSLMRVELFAMMARIHNLRGEYAKCIRLCRQGLATPGWRHRLTWARLNGLLGTSAAELGKYAEAEEHYRRAIAVMAREKDLTGEGLLQYLIAINVYCPRGEFRAAKQAGRRALLLLRRVGDRHGTYVSLGVLGFVAAASGGETESRDLSDDALRQATSSGDRSFQAFCHLSLGRCGLLRGDLAAAEEHFLIAQRIGESLGETDLRTYPQLGLAEAALARGNRHAALSAAREALQSARQTQDPLQQAQAAALLGLAHAGSAGRARAWWRRSERTLRAIGARYELHRLLLLRLHAGDVPASRVPAALEELLSGVARMQHEPLFLTAERARGLAVLGLALRQGVERDLVASLLLSLGDEAVPELQRLSRERELTDVCVRLLGKIGGEAAAEALAPLRDPTTRAGRVALRAWEEVSRSPESPLRISALGRLRVAVGDRELPSGAWRSTRALRLFLLLLRRRFRWVATDEIVEALWPGVEPEKGRNNLVQTVYLLRKTLQPELRQAKLSRYVLSRPDACRLEPGRAFAYDVQQFEDCLTRAQGTERTGQRDAAERLLREAIELYQGDLLEELPYEELVAEERERLRERLLGAVTRLLSLLEGSRRQGEIVPLCTLGLSRDPYREEFHAHLISHHLAAGNRADALACYHQYERLLRRDLGLLPSARMQALAERIAATRRKPI
jgi:LuxR family transcriptional regulator, maltose regulon positive regulatory protein